LDFAKRLSVWFGSPHSSYSSLILIFGAVLGQATAANAQSFDDGAGVSTVVTILPPGTFTQVPPASLPIDLSTKTTFGSAAWNYYFTSPSVYDMPVDALPQESNAVFSIADDAASSWIGFPEANEYEWPSTTSLTFWTKFYLTGIDLSTLYLSGSWAAWGYGATLELNGVVLAAWDDPGNPPTRLLPFSAPASSLLQDTNTLSITFNLDPNAETVVSASDNFAGAAARVSAMVTEVPEPSTWAMVPGPLP
jgi:hypothetical protein